MIELPRDICSGSGLDCVKLLMELQYRFPLTKTPIADVASRLGYDVYQVLDVLGKLRELGVVKRVGFYYNVRASRKAVALIAFKTDDPENLALEAMRNLEVTHNYLRDCERYNLWIVARSESAEKLRSIVSNLASKFRASWSILWAERTYRLSVKYDLERGVSRAGYMRELPLNPPSPESLGIPRRLPLELRSLPLTVRPYRAIGEKLGLSEEQVYRNMLLMLEKGILADPGLTLDGHRVGFRVNVMYTVKPRDGVSYPELCRWITENVSEATHIVLRRADPPGSWEHLCYFMVHAVSEEALKSVDSLLERSPLVGSFLKLRSLRDFAPGIVR